MVTIMANQRFTLIATVRNEAGTIKEFVDSLLRQSRPPEEILIVDGASTDGTREILEDYAKRGLLRVISQPCNIAQGRNLGIAAASGSHLAVTDAGCRVDVDWLANIARCFSSSPAPDVVAGNFKFDTHTRFEEAVVHATFQPNRDNTQTARYYPSSRSVAFTKAAWEKAGGYPDWLYAAEDTLFNIRMRQAGCHFVFCRDAIVRWRPRENWRALARQRINFSRGNARVGIGTSGYFINLRVHLALAAFLLSGLWFKPMYLVALALFGWHVRKHLWPQTVATTPHSDWKMRWLVLSVMEFVRVVNLYGFLLGRWDRFSDPSYINRQIAYMGVSSVDALDFSKSPGQYRKKELSLKLDIHDKQLIGLGLTCLVSALFVVQGLASLGWVGVWQVVSVATITTAALISKSLADFTQTGPRIRDEILTHYQRYTLFSLARLSVWAFAIMLFNGAFGALIYSLLITVLDVPWSPIFTLLAATLGILAATILQFLKKLRFNPGLLVASMHYRMSRFYGVWSFFTPVLLKVIQFGLAFALALLLIIATKHLVVVEAYDEILTLWAAVIFYVGVITLAGWQPDAKSTRNNSAQQKRDLPNILMIGSDTLRADRLGSLGYHRSLTPNLDLLASRGTLFSNCYVPCARTAPSLVSLLTGTWPHTHGIRDNFVAVENTVLKSCTLPQLLKTKGYRTAAISDWCGADLGKFSFGFDYTDLPEDQWGLKYLIRQGPKDLRLFLSLFIHNRIGRLLLPEIYYLGGVPLTQTIGKRARHFVSRLAENDAPFFLNLFYSTTHPPFASEWPWYTKFSDSSYAGESKFAMARLADPFDIIRRQGAPKEEFDLDQIIDLYDGCVAEFDDEVGKMLRHLEASGLSDNTIVVIYSDHGMEFFEHESWGQGNSAVGDFSPRVPLIIAGSSLSVGRIDAVVRSIDLMPTLLEITGIPLPSRLEGVSLIPLLKGEPLESLPAFNETGIWFTDIPGLPEKHLRYPDLMDLLEVPDRKSGALAVKPEYEAIIIKAKDRMIRSANWKLVYQPLVDGYILRLFNLETDPNCINDIAGMKPEITARLWAQLENWMSQDCLFEEVRGKTDTKDLTGNAWSAVED